MPKIPSLTFKDGKTIPQLGLGVWQIPESDLPDIVSKAVELGYRLIDGAFIYGNEAAMGDGIRQSGIARQELFVTSKVWNSEQGYDKARKAIDGSLKRIGLEYLDLALIHWPCPQQDNYVETWKALVAAKADGQLASIGVSNFNANHLDRIMNETGETPFLNQIEVNPRLQQADMRAQNEKRSILTQAWTPLGQGVSFNAPEIAAICKRTGKSPIQVILRWHLKLGVSVIPRSTSTKHLVSNIDIFDFELTSDDMAAISKLEAGVRCGPDPEDFEAM
ncbi:MAG: aldo/keto reductase [Roseibium sp.]